MRLTWLKAIAVLVIIFGVQWAMMTVTLNAGSRVLAERQGFAVDDHLGRLSTILYAAAPAVGLAAGLVAGRLIPVKRGPFRVIAVLAIGVAAALLTLFIASIGLSHAYPRAAAGG